MFSRTGRPLTVVVVWLGLYLPRLAIADESVPVTYRLVAAEQGIPAQIFYALALAESGKAIKNLKATRPWPWTLNIAGKGVYFNSRLEAWQALNASLQAGESSVDIGLMQVNWHFHQQRLKNSWLALDPQHNLRVAANVLKDCYRQRRDWWASVGCYHTPANTERAKRYRARVLAEWRNLGGKP